MTEHRSRAPSCSHCAATKDAISTPDTPLGRPGQPGELPPLYVFLAGEESRYICGEVVGATGGKPPHRPPTPRPKDVSEMSEPNRRHDDEHDRPQGDKPGAEGGESDAARKPPAAPAEDSSPLGDTDQHSDADA